ncbi:Hint domain-containing protein [Roseovarius sp. Pro17]|uniref:Hint domain-containing protein n=1 Tax=Roseovarius sp. Pro17 TaxID=3108175 RepID=UPI002D76F63A|nr:Hint domain-containing protein [Roseovarius sp. Pro17]
MPTTYSDQFWLIDPSAPPTAGSTLSVSVFDIIDQDDNDLIDQLAGDSVDGVGITRSYPGDTVTVTIPGGATVTITGVTFYLADGRVVFTPSDGSALETSTFVSSTFVNTQGPLPVSSLGPPCFVAGTLIETADGKKAVETLEPGEIIIGYGGEQLILTKVLRSSLFIRDLVNNPNLRPVRIMAGSLGNGLPERDLLVSRQHRMLVQSRIAERMFDTSEVLISAIKLTGMAGIFVDESITAVEYVHVLFEQHEIIYAEGAPTESLFTGPEALKGISLEAREEILSIFPEIAELDYSPEPARFIPSSRLQKQLIARHLKNNKPVVSELRN